MGALERREIRVHDALPITTPARTIIDVAGDSAPGELKQAVAEAFALRLTSRPAVLAMIDLHPHRPGVRALRGLLDADQGPARTRSPAEKRLLALIRAAGLPAPEVNVRLGRWEVDFLWRGHQLVVEVDGYASHSSPRAFERDHRKTAELQDAGFIVRRLSAVAVRDEPDASVDRIARALGCVVSGPSKRRSRRGG